MSQDSDWSKSSVASSVPPSPGPLFRALHKAMFPKTVPCNEPTIVAPQAKAPAQPPNPPTFSRRRTRQRAYACPPRYFEPILRAMPEQTFEQLVPPPPPAPTPSLQAQKTADFVRKHISASWFEDAETMNNLPSSFKATIRAALMHFIHTKIDPLDDHHDEKGDQDQFEAQIQVLMKEIPVGSRSWSWLEVYEFPIACDSQKMENKEHDNDEVDDDEDDDDGVDDWLNLDDPVLGSLREEYPRAEEALGYYDAACTPRVLAYGYDLHNHYNKLNSTLKSFSASIEPTTTGGLRSNPDSSTKVWDLIQGLTSLESRIKRGLEFKQKVVNTIRALEREIQIRKEEDALS